MKLTFSFDKDEIKQLAQGEVPGRLLLFLKSIVPEFCEHQKVKWTQLRKDHGKKELIKPIHFERDYGDI